MKKYLLILLLGLSLKALAQAPATKIVPKLEQTSVVKDPDGLTLPYAVWKKMLETGEYSVKPVEKGSKEFVIYQLTEIEKSIRAERLKALIPAMGKPMASSSFKEGDKFVGERITDMNGNKFDLKKISDKIYVINFWFIDCAPCRDEIPELNELVKQYKDNKDVVFLAIALDDRYTIKQFLKTLPFSYNIVDDGRYYANKYGVKSYPTHVIIGKDGLIKFSTVGLAPHTMHWIEKTIKEQL
ncbi:TlpA disulfide reductase family protein [Pedobacter sp. KR3-3]|uniref:TlpA disulfide reductase family protein n=1 Tax=Pedobacter albus TaxID=3113905 RepID=A0ABU7I4N7_9SPHI|nr:TlpA disulfide reductase family protein [Pedobacter sp. KR3-3]MEE1944291.1 TlpA disulfide reductase family protein [Pedobacter sp. KR3-3]